MSNKTPPNGRVCDYCGCGENRFRWKGCCTPGVTQEINEWHLYSDSPEKFRAWCETFGVDRFVGHGNCFFAALDKSTTRHPHLND